MTRSRYPRHGHRLAPALLRELLLIPIPTKYLKSRRKTSGQRLPPLMLCDLDESAWDEFPASTCEELAQEVLDAVARNTRLPMPIQNHRLPPIPDGMTLADLELEARTINCLVSAGIHEHPQQLQSLTIEGVLTLRGFWVKSLVDLLTSLEYVTDHREARRATRVGAISTVKQFREVHRYPRPGHRIAPLTLKEVLLDRLSPRLVRGTKFRNRRLCDLDETAWDHLDREAIAALAELTVVRAGSCAYFPPILQRHLPRPPEEMRLEDLRLENRTHNCLERKGYKEHPGRLGELTVAGLLSIPSFGSKCLVDLLSSLETLAAHEGKLDAELTVDAKALGATAGAAKISFADPRLGGLLRAMDTESDTVGEMLTRIVDRRLDPPDPLQLREQIAEFREKIGQLSKLPLEEELIQIFAPDFAPRDRRIVVEYYGWDGRGSHTLEVLGKKYGLSRERIRQVCVKAVKRARDVKVFAPVLDRTLEFLGTQYPKGLKRVQAEFDASGLCGCPLPVESIGQVAGFLGRKVAFTIIEVGDTRLMVHSRHVKFPRLIVQVAKHVLTSHGAARIPDVTSQLAKRFSKKVNPVLVRETLQARDDFCWLDEQCNWFRLSVLPQYGLPNMIDKILSVTGRVDISRVRSAMARYRRGNRKLPPPKVLLEFARQMPHVRVEGNTLIAEPPLDWREVLADVERNMVEVLKEHGPILERTSFEEFCIAKGTNPFSFNAILMSSPVIEQYGRSVYGLLGMKVDRATVDDLLSHKVASSPSRVLEDYGRLADGRPYLVYRLSKAAISGGVITIPAAMKRQLRGKFALCQADGKRIGTLATRQGCAWGLGPALRRRNAGYGQQMLLLFDIPKREVEMRTGDEAVLAELSEG